jgi:hypothetical protein
MVAHFVVALVSIATIKQENTWHSKRADHNDIEKG